MKRLSPPVQLAVGSLGWLILLSLLYPVVVTKNGDISQKFDAWIYYYATSHWVQSGSLYDFYAFPADHLYPFTYPPFAAWLMRGMTIFSFNQAQVLLSTLTIAATAWCVWVCFRFLGVELRISTIVTPWISAGALLTLEPLIKTLEYGQINVILMALVLTDIWALDLLPASHPLRRIQGLGCALAACIKITPAIAIAVFIMSRRWRQVAVMTSTSVGITALVGLISPRETLDYFTTYLWDPSRTGEYTYAGNQNLMGLFSRLLPESAAFSAWAVTCTGLVMMVMTAGWRIMASHTNERSNLGLITCMVMTLGLLISPITWSHHWVWILPSVMITAWLAVKRAEEIWLWVAGSGLLVAWMAPHWWWPEHGGIEKTWPLWAQLLSSSNTWWGLAFLIIATHVYAVGSRQIALKVEPDL
ncbi:glycosyltransferase 87 family protein [Actinomyces vulturis]|uniref:glycosyltransferase 87 family protein n=1 Tax=Actinomyces vulturis TaxID=1857645 RepID=UPI00159EF09B|nr:glycosyltransferase 87 family protein [Actinomyces vulturis]